MPAATSFVPLTRVQTTRTRSSMPPDTEMLALLFAITAASLPWMATRSQVQFAPSKRRRPKTGFVSVSSISNSVPLQPISTPRLNP